MEIKIEQLKTFLPGMTESFNNLLLQLNSSAKTLSDEDVKKVIEATGNRLFVAKEIVGNKIIGMLTLVVINAFVAQ